MTAQLAPLVGLRQPIKTILGRPFSMTQPCEQTATEREMEKATDNERCGSWTWYLLDVEYGQAQSKSTYVGTQQERPPATGLSTPSSTISQQSSQIQYCQQWPQINSIETIVWSHEGNQQAVGGSS